MGPSEPSEPGPSAPESTGLLKLASGAELALRRWGSGPPLLLVHGFGGSSATWARVLPGLKGHQILAPDLPGHGASPPPPHGYGFPDLVEDLRGLLDQLEIPSASVAGYSMGGRIALALAAAAPARVRALVLESASPGLERSEERAARREEDAALAEAIESRGMPWFWDHWDALPLFEPRTRAADLDRELAEALRAGRAGASARGLASALRAFGTGSQPSYWDRLDQLPPTRVVVGERDPKFVGIGRAMVRRGSGGIEGAGPGQGWDLRVVAGSGHSVHLEAPAEWIKVVTEFLGAVAPG